MFKCSPKTFKSIRTLNPHDHVELPVREVLMFLESFVRFFLNFHLHLKDIVSILCILLVYAYCGSMCSLLHLADTNFPSDSYITALLSLSCISMFTCPTWTASHSSEGRTGIDTAASTSITSTISTTCAHTRKDITTTLPFSSVVLMHSSVHLE